MGEASRRKREGRARPTLVPSRVFDQHQHPSSAALRRGDGDVCVWFARQAHDKGFFAESLADGQVWILEAIYNDGRRWDVCAGGLDLAQLPAALGLGPDKLEVLWVAVASIEQLGGLPVVVHYIFEERRKVAIVNLSKSVPERAAQAAPAGPPS